MATTVYSGIIDPRVFSAYLQELTVEKSLLIRSGIVERNPLLDSFLAGGGQYIEMPKWQELSDAEANNSSFSSNPAPIEAVSSVQENGVRLNRNKAFGARDMAAALAGSDPMDVIANRFADWWVRHDQRLVLAILGGLLQEDIDGDGEADLLNNISVSGSVAGAANKFSAEALLDTFQLLGDGKINITALAVHSYIHTQMQKQNLIDYTPDSEANIGFGTYMGKTLLVDDGLTITPGNDGGGNDQPAYDTIAFAPGAFQLGFGNPRVPVETEREPLTGDGGGEEYIITRREMVMHPVGFSIDMTYANGLLATHRQSLSNAQLGAAGAYARTDAAGARQRAQRFCVLRSN
jgi:hypothetical protein